LPLVPLDNRHKTMHNDGESSPRMLPEANKLVQLSLISFEVPKLDAKLNFGMLNRNGRIEMWIIWYLECYKSNLDDVKPSKKRDWTLNKRCFIGSKMVEMRSVCLKDKQLTPRRLRTIKLSSILLLQKQVFSPFNVFDKMVSPLQKSVASHPPRTQVFILTSPCSSHKQGINTSTHKGHFAW
jgi:hypothetical protein